MIKDGLRVGGVYRTRNSNIVLIREQEEDSFFGSNAHWYRRDGTLASYESVGDLVSEVPTTDQPKMGNVWDGMETSDPVSPDGQTLWYATGLHKRSLAPEPITPRLWLAGMALQGMLASGKYFADWNDEQLASSSLEKADAILAASKGEANG